MNYNRRANRDPVETAVDGDKEKGREKNFGAKYT